MLPFTLSLPLPILPPLAPPPAFAGEYYIQPGNNTLTTDIKNLKCSVGPVTIKVKVEVKSTQGQGQGQGSDWLSITPGEQTISDIAPDETKPVTFTLIADCNLETLQKISGDVTFTYESITEGTIDPIRERTHTFIIDKAISFVANKKTDGTGTVTAINLNPCEGVNVGKSLAQLTVGAKPHGVAVSADGQRIYVANEGDGTMSVLDLHFDPNDPDPGFDDAQETKVDLGQGFTPSLITITPDNSRVYIADRIKGVIKVINLIYWTDFGGGYSIPGIVRAPYEYKEDIPIVGQGGVKGDMLQAMAIDPSGRRLWVVVRKGYNTESDGGCVAVVDIEQVIKREDAWQRYNSIIDVVDLQRMEQGPLNEPSSIAFTPDGDLAYITGEGTTRLIPEIMNWEDGTGGVVAVDPQAIYDDSAFQGGAKLIDYIPPHVLGSKADLYFITMPRVDYTPFMGFGLGAAASIFYSMQESYNTLASLYDQTIYRYPVDTDGAKSVAISPDGKKAYITFANTNNFGFINLSPSETAGGFNAGNLPVDNDIIAASEAILPAIRWDETNPFGAFRMPNEISFSQDGRYAIISNMNDNDDLVLIVDNKDVEKVLASVDLEDLQKDPIDKFSTGNLIHYVGEVSGIDNPEGIAITTGGDTDGDMHTGGASNLVEAKNRFNSLLTLPEGLSKSSLISTNDSNLLSPVIPNSQDLSKSRGVAYGDNLNNYDKKYLVDSQPGALINSVLLPTEGLGYRHEFGKDLYNSNNAGTLLLINVLEDISNQWFLHHSEGPRIVYLDLSRPGGGQFWDKDIGCQRHAAHQNGLDVNVRYIRKDKSENYFDFVPSNMTGNEKDNLVQNTEDYDPVLSTELINLFLADERVTRVAVDPLVIELAKEAGVTVSASDKLLVRGDILDPTSRRDYDDHFGVRVGERNFSPVADARFADGSRYKIVNEGEMFTLNGLGSFDPDGGNLASYQWIQDSGPSAGLTKEKGENPVVSLPCPASSNPGVGHAYMVFGLTVFDGEFESQKDTVRVKINRKPVAHAGDDQTIEQAGQVVRLDGSQSLDPDGDELLYSWSQIDGTPVEMSDTSEANPSFYAPDQDTTLVFELRVNDTYTDSEVDSVTITIDVPEKPEE